MNKPLGVLVGIVVLAGALNTAGAWYTGTKLEGVIKTSLEQANLELASQLEGSTTQATLELVSFDRHLYSSTAQYRLNIQDDSAESDEPLTLLFVDNIEHGPLPWSRIKTFKWMPVMATSNYALEKTPFTEKWFAAAKDQAPLQGQLTVDYNRAVEGHLQLLPLDMQLDEHSTLSFSGMTMEGQSDADGQHLKGRGYMDHLKIHAASLDKPPVQIELNGLTVASDLNKSSYGFYLGQNVMSLTDGQMTYGARQSVINVKQFEYTGSASAKENLLSGRLAYTLGEIALDGKPVGSAQLVMTASHLDIPAMQSLMQVYQTKLQSQVDDTLPQTPFTEAEQALIQADVEKLLAPKPQLAVEKLSLKTANGESQFSLSANLANPASFVQPPLELVQQLVTSLDAKLTLSKPMIADLTAVQAQLDGETDSQAIAQVASMNSEMVGMMAVQTGLAKVDGDNIVASLNYAAGKVDLNGQVMPLEALINAMVLRLGLGGQ